MVSAVDLAKRALVILLKSLAASYGLSLELRRDTPDNLVRNACRKVSRKVHPDQGGDPEQQKALNNARDAWEEALKRSKGRGRPSSTGAVVSVWQQKKAEEKEKEFRFQSLGVLLTYQKFPDESCWKRFLVFLERCLSLWKVRFWCATLETNGDGTKHLHVMLQFYKAADRHAETFRFEGVRPNARPHDLLGEGWGGRRLQASLDRGFFYTWAAKEGTARDEQGNLCVAGNYEPAWTTAKCKYTVSGKWLDSLFRAYKLSPDTYEEYLYLCRDNVVSRKRNLDALRAQTAAVERKREIEERAKSLRSDPAVFQPFKPVAEARAWLEVFERKAMRYPLLVVFAPSHTGKTEFAKSLFERPFKVEIGDLPHFPDKMRQFDKKRFDGIVLDDVRDLSFVALHQEKLQGNYEAELEFGSTAGGTCVYYQDLWKVPVAVTVNFSTRNLDFLATHDYLSKKENVHFLAFSGRPGEAPPQTSWPLKGDWARKGA